MLNSRKWSSTTHSQMTLIILLVFCLITGAPLLQTANAKSRPHQTPHKKHVHQTHTGQKKITRARHPASPVAMHTKLDAPKHAGSPTLPYPSLSQSDSANHSLALVNTLHLAGTPEEPRRNTSMLKNINSNRAITPAQKNLVDFVDHTVYNLNYSSYRLGGGRFDTSNGIYVLDCSRFVDSVLSRVYPAAYSSLVDATGSEKPASQHYYDFFSDLSNRTNDVHWNKVEKIGQLRPGDILVFRYRKPRGRVQGHVMVIMDKPRAAENAWLVRVADSAPVRHSADTRQHNESGIGIGTLLLKPSPTGKPAAYAWGMGGSWRKNVKFAMARPLKMDV